MKKLLKLLLLLCLALTFALSVALLSACDETEDPNEFVNGQGNTVKVILDSISDPTIKNSVDKVSNGYIDYRLKEGSPIPQPGVTQNTVAPIAEGFIFEGYYEGFVDSSGKLIYGDKWDFSRKVDSDITLYGKWLIQYKICIKYVLNGQLQENFEEVNIIGNAESVTSIKTPSWSGNTFVQLYEDEQCTEVLAVSDEKPFVHGCTQQEPTRNVYAEFMPGTWTLVRNATDIRTFYSGSNLYFMNDVDINDLKDSKGNVSISIPADYNGTIEGNGHTISNLNYTREGTTGTQKATNYCLGLFARLNSATVRNLTFKDCTVNGVVRQTNNEGYYYGFLAGLAQGTCVLEDITFDNCTLGRFTFNVAGGISAEQEAAERLKISQNAFIGEVEQTCTVKGVVSDGITQAQAASTESAQVAMLPTTKKD